MLTHSLTLVNQFGSGGTRERTGWLCEGVFGDGGVVGMETGHIRGICTARKDTVIRREGLRGKGMQYIDEKKWLYMSRCKKNGIYIGADAHGSDDRWQVRSFSFLPIISRCFAERSVIIVLRKEKKEMGKTRSRSRRTRASRYAERRKI